MAKFSLSLAVVLAVSVDVALSGFASGWGQLRSGRPGFGQVGFKDGKCSATGMIPDPKSGCCGRHAGTDGNTPGDGNQNGDEVDGYDPNPAGYGPGNDGNVIDNRNDYSDIGTCLWGGLGGNGVDDYENIFGGGLWNFNEEYRRKRSADNASDNAPNKFIMAGRRAGIAQYPWLVHLQVAIEHGTKVVGCGASLVSSRHVITAAHCLAHDIEKYEDVYIVLAEYNTNSYPTDCVGRLCIKNVVMHPDKISIHNGYRPGTLHNDIGMMRLSEPAPYTDYIRPICLPPFNINTARNEGFPLAITGWGQTENQLASPVKLHAQVQLVAASTCQNYYDDLTEGQLCAASNNGQDTCVGDSGGPIMAEHEGNLYLVGLVSGKTADAGCGSPVPTIYTNVHSYMNWIKDFMRD